MPRNNFPPRARPHDARGRTRQPASTAAATRKVFNCIVDDTALIAGVKPSTRDGIRKWVSQGAIRLFVPLHTLEQLGRLSKSNERGASDAQEALVWLDTVTSHATLGKNVRLQGSDETYVTWKAVEQFLLPETLLSINDMESEDGSDYVEDLDASFANLDVSDGTSLSSSHSDRPQTPSSPDHALPAENKVKVQNGNPKGLAIKPSPARAPQSVSELLRAGGPSKSTVPGHLRPLFSHILWLIHRETNPHSALESFILLTNDPAKQAIAQKFGIRAKRLEQLRDAVGREDREYRNHLIFNKKESGELGPSSLPAESGEEQVEVQRPKSNNSSTSKYSNNRNNDGVESDDEDEVVFRPVSRGSQVSKLSGQRVWDPNDFARTNAPRGGRGGRGRGGFAGPARGRGGPARGRGGFLPHGAYAAPSGTFRPTAVSPAPRSNPDSNTILNPDSYDRPAPRVTGTRGGRRKLWEPN